MCAWLLFLALVYLFAIQRTAGTSGWFGASSEPLLVTQLLAILGVASCAVLALWVIIKPQRTYQMWIMWLLTAGSMAITLSNL